MSIMGHLDGYQYAQNIGIKRISCFVVALHVQGASVLNSSCEVFFINFLLSFHPAVDAL